MSDGLVARMVWIGCEDGCDRLRGLCGMLSSWPIRTADLRRLTGRPTLNAVKLIYQECDERRI